MDSKFCEQSQKRNSLLFAANATKTEISIQVHLYTSIHNLHPSIRVQDLC